MEFMKEKGAFIIFATIMFSITLFGAWTIKMEDAYLEIEEEYVMANLY